MPRPYKSKLIKIEQNQEFILIPDLSIQEVEDIWKKCCQMPGFSQLDIHQFSKEIILKLREKVNGNHA